MAKKYPFDELEEGVPIPQCFVAPIIDTSGSMYNILPLINEAISELLPILKEIELDECIDISFMPIGFANQARWLRAPNDDGCEWDKEKLVASGGSNLESAFNLLYDKLKSEKEGGWLRREATRPVLVLITDGYPEQGWERALEELNKVNAFKNAIRYAIELNDVDERVLLKFADEDAVIRVWKNTDIKELFMELIVLAIQEARCTDSLLLNDGISKEKIIRRINEAIFYKEEEL